VNSGYTAILFDESKEKKRTLTANYHQL